MFQLLSGKILYKKTNQIKCFLTDVFQFSHKLTLDSMRPMTSEPLIGTLSLNYNAKTIAKKDINSWSLELKHSLGVQ